MDRTIGICAALLLLTITAAAAQATISVQVNPGAYQGEWHVSEGTPSTFVTGPQTMEVEPGANFMFVGGISGFPFSNCGMRPYISAWSEMTRKSRGRESLALRPCVVVTSSPRAKRKASSCPIRHIVPASTETAVCRCVSPQKTRVG